ncbi:anaerobic ribonucleoside-triphosphate reductase activating protein [Thermosulfuriphilus sp.]
MKLPKIKGFLETSFIDWPGRITASVWVSGCNLRCPFCHNSELLLNPENLPDWPLEEILRRLEKNLLFVESICVSGGEPTIHLGIFELLRIFKDLGLAIKLDTNGTRPEVIKELISSSLVDFIAMDVKAPLVEEKYIRLTGRKDLDLSAIKKSISIILNSGIDHQFRMTVIPGIHQKEDIIIWVQDLKGAQMLTLQNFSPQKTLDPTFQKIRPFDEEEFANFCALVERYRQDLSQHIRTRT